MNGKSVIDAALARLAGASLIFVDGVWVNESVRGRDLKYYIFDWDDNVLCMPTRIHLERLEESSGQWVPHVCSTAIYSVVRKDTEHYRFPQNNREYAFAEFQDICTPYGGGKFLQDLECALDSIENGQHRPPPSFNVFRKTLVEGRLFAIVTARGHEAETLRKGVLRFIERVLSSIEREEMLINLRGYSYCFDHLQTFPSQRDVLNRYLDLCHYHAITSKTFGATLAETDPMLLSQEDRKQFAIHDFIDHLVDILDRTGMAALRLPIAVGFSDDDPHNVEAVRKYIEQVLVYRFPTVKFCVYDTSEPESGTHKMMISGQMELGLE
ncbi:MAG: hypothetical protein RR133_00420 [Kiritimatiellia bacterium]